MADSNITKRALATALKELMAEFSFEKINVAQICEKCDMNRKSFYYHFKDKYDLVNWIFDTEFIAVVNRESIVDGWDFLLELCSYLYTNRDFYRKALKIKGQNSFPDHFREMIQPVVTEHMRQLLSVEQVEEFYINFISDGFVCAIERWIQEKDCKAPEEFVGLLKNCIQLTAAKLYLDMNPSE